MTSGTLGFGFIFAFLLGAVLAAVRDAVRPWRLRTMWALAAITMFTLGFVLAP